MSDIDISTYVFKIKNFKPQHFNVKVGTLYIKHSQSTKLKWKNLPYHHCNCAMADNEKSERKEEKEHHQDVDVATWRKKIEIIGINIKNLDIENQTRRLKLRTTFM